MSIFRHNRIEELSDGLFLNTQDLETLDLGRTGCNTSTAKFFDSKDSLGTFTWTKTC